MMEDWVWAARKSKIVKRRKCMVLNVQGAAFVLFIFCSLALHSTITSSAFDLHVCTSVWSGSGGVCLCISTSTKAGKCSSNNQCWDEGPFWRRYRCYKGSKHFLWRCCLDNSLCKTNLLDTYWKVKFLCLVCVSEQMDFESLGSSSLGHESTERFHLPDRCLVCSSEWSSLNDSFSGLLHFGVCTWSATPMWIMQRDKTDELWDRWVRYTSVSCAPQLKYG